MSQTKSSRTQDYQPSTHFVLRSPLLPYDELLALREGLSAPHARPDELDESVASDRTLVRRRLRGLAQRPEVKEAIFFASPDLGSALDRWLATEAPSPKLELTLAKYFARMCGRPSPFGLFAGISIGVVSEESSLELPPRQAYRPSTHLELSLLSTVVEHLESDPALERRLRFRPAVTVERRGSRVRYVDRAKSQKSAERSEYLDAALDRAGPLATLEELATAVQLAADADPEEATAFVRGLVERGLLRSELEPAITGPEPLDLLADRLDGLSPSSAEGAAERARGGAVVSRFRAELRRLDQQSVGRPTHAFRQLFESLGELSGSVELPHAFHVDLVKPATKLTLSHEVVDELARAVGVLRRFHRTPSSDELEVFRKRFVDRYEGRSVPLTEVFDESSGPSYPPIEPNAPIPWAPTDSWLLERTLAARAQHQDEIEIVEGELATLDALRGPDQKPLPGSFGVMASLAAASEDALRRGDFRLHLGGQHGPSGATTLGRFCHSDPRLAPLVEEIIRSEEAERPGVLFAELVTSPDPSLSNLVVRPVFRAHEIPILARGSGPIASRIPLSDLVVSVRNGRFVLYSRSRGLEVVPRLTSALNFRHKSCSPLFRFLGSLQIEGLATVFGFEWGLLATTRALPRVRYRKTVLALARWRLDGSWTERLANAKTDSARVRLVRQLRDELGVPRMVHLVELDTFLILDLDDVLSIHILCQSCTGRPSALLTEAFSSSGPVLRGPEGRFVHDLVITFTQTRREEVPKPRVELGAPVSATDVPTVRREPVRRILLPGSPWVFAKLYASPAAVDDLLATRLGGWIRALAESQLIDRWFFVRYGDPEWHLRLRLRARSRSLAGRVISRLGRFAESLTDPSSELRIRTLELGTYERELERYGPEAMTATERLFHADSRCVLAILEGLSRRDDTEERLRIAVAGVSALWSALGVEETGRLDLARTLRGSFEKEVAPTASQQRALADRFRGERPRLSKLLDSTDSAAFMTHFADRTSELGPVRRRLARLEERGRVSANREDRAGAYAHMFVNRLLRFEHRRAELIIYYDLERLYESRSAQVRQKGLE